MNELIFNDAFLQTAEIPEILGNGIRNEDLEALNFDNFLKEFSI